MWYALCPPAALRESMRGPWPGGTFGSELEVYLNRKIRETMSRGRRARFPEESARVCDPTQGVVDQSAGHAGLLGPLRNVTGGGQGAVVDKLPDHVAISLLPHPVWCPICHSAVAHAAVAAPDDLC